MVLICYTFDFWELFIIITECVQTSEISPNGLKQINRGKSGTLATWSRTKVLLSHFLKGLLVERSVVIK
uniref:Uncharacterized protein n=1 Tax=Arundo donax TaxID=35708 RepID=A0A0A9G2H4_ARUDO